jgi:malonyl CoA-acyl carrier protein transacylase
VKLTNDEMFAALTFVPLMLFCGVSLGIVSALAVYAIRCLTVFLGIGP